VGKSIELSTSDDFFNKREEIIRIIDGIVKGDKSKALSSIDFFNENKDSIDEILDIFLIWFRDLIIYKETGKNEFIFNKDKIDFLRVHSFMEFTQINDIIYKIQETKDNINKNVNFQLSIETMLLKIQEEF
jgi:DNA polymerase-3 subunit delta'